MYHVTFLTPPYKGSNHIAHIVEHCVYSSFFDTYQKFIEHYNNISAESTNFYTQFSFSSEELLYLFLPQFQQPISKEIYKREQKRIVDELSDKQYKQELFTYIQEILGENIHISSASSYTFKTVQSYKDSCYNNMYILDSNYSILNKKILSKEFERKPL